VADATLRINADTREAQRALGGLQNSLKALVTGTVVSAFIKLSDQTTELRNRLNQVSSSVEQNNALFEGLIRVANTSRTSLSTTGDLFFRIARSAEDLGISQNQALLATELVAKAISSAGISAQEASGPLLQLGQALQSGRLQGDELRSILEGLPPVAKAIADSLGVPIGELRRLGSEGKISSQQVIQGILAAQRTIEGDFSKTIPTIAQSFVLVTNSLLVFIDKINQSSQAQTAFGKAAGYIIATINFLGDNIETIIAIFEILATLFLVGRAIQALKFLGRGFIALGNQVKSVGYVFTDFGKFITTNFGNIIKFWRSAFTTMNKAAEAGISGIAYYWRGFFVYFGTIVKSIGSVLLNLGVPITLVTGYFTDFFDTAINGAKRLLSYLPIIGKYFGDIGKTDQSKVAKDTQAVADAMNKAGKGVTIMSDGQRNFNKQFEKSMNQQEYALNLQTGKVYYTDQERAILEEINKQQESAIAQGAVLGSQQIARIRSYMEQEGSLERMKKQMEEINAAGTAVVSGAARGSDPRLAVEQDFINQKIELENYFIANSLVTQETYEQTLLNLTLQYELAKYEATLGYLDQLDKYKEMQYARDLERQGFSFRQAQEYAKARVEFEKKTEMEKTQFAIEQGANVFNELGKYNRQAFAAAKAFNIANAIMNTYTGATKALATYPPPFNFIAAAATVAAGLGQIATIRSQQYSGRAIGGSVAQGSSYIVGENGPEVFTPQGQGRITANNQLGDSGPLNVTFNIQANDARGFDQLLAERRPMIINMIKSAQNDRGNKSNL
jgi:tape measure domain-containing protein